MFYTFKGVPRLKKESSIIVAEPTFMQNMDVDIEYNAEVATAAKQQIWNEYAKQRDKLIAGGAVPAIVSMNTNGYKLLLADVSKKAHQAVVASHMEECLIVVNPKQIEMLVVLCPPTQEFFNETELVKVREAE